MNKMLIIQMFYSRRIGRSLSTDDDNVFDVDFCITHPRVMAIQFDELMLLLLPFLLMNFILIPLLPNAHHQIAARLLHVIAK